MLKALEFRLKLEQIDKLISRGYSIESAAAQVGVNVASYTLWLAEHDNQVPVSIERLEHLQTENSRLRRALAKLSVELRDVKGGGPVLDVFAQAA